MTGSRMLTLGHYQPADVMTNDDLARVIDTSDEWIRRRVGVRTRHIAAKDESVADMAAQAASKALAKSGLAAEDIDLVVVATCTSVDRTPNVAARTALQLGIPSPAALDVNTACSGFTHALALADSMIRTSIATKSLVVGVEKLSGFTDWSDRTTCVLIGDGAGAAVVVASDVPEISPVVWGSIPEMGRAVLIEGPLGSFAQDGKAVYRWATTKLPAIALQVCQRARVAPEELGGVILHQANLRIIDTVVRQLGAVNAVIARDIVDSGNTSAASIPLAFSKLVEQGQIAASAPVLLLGFGGGLSYAGQIVHCPGAASGH